MDGGVVSTPKERRKTVVRKVLIRASIALLIPIGIVTFLYAVGPSVPEGRVSASAPSSEIRQPSAFYMTLAYVHFATIAPCFLMGIWLLLRPKGTPIHKQLGKIYVVLISFSSVVAAAMPAAAGPRLWNHFGIIHLFCVAVFISIPYAIWAIKRGNVRGHAWAMRGLFLGGVVIAGAFTLLPGRLLHAWLFL